MVTLWGNYEGISQRSATFGDGYEQIAGEGINPEKQSWPVTLTGKKADMLQALKFFRSHVTKSFIWTSPVGETGLYRIEAESIKSQPLSRNVLTISSTFKQAYTP
ncbi:phage tail protein [Enterobacter hormaechei subsp. xiangfangensis]|uniref:phage tail protein n=1 Tax=Enterobacter hormaechei TaxID=158836 RepID=UPI00256BB9A5|nr:phage tail protein [Enterobacter hormaechei]MDL4071092.1 phage tail protein [Enterobacter hormaechei subsp. xiangfangensis]MDS0002383.1 phage tail protein [Enterobacter hormaechei subsp. xiangfangensis]